MKTIYLLRHAKSDWEADYATDHERPLAKRGRKAAKAVGLFLMSSGQLPDRILSSTAVRARTTIERAKEKGGWPARPYVTDRALYEAGASDLLAFVRQQPEGASSVMLVGHEPTMSETISRFVGGGDVRVPTAAVARIDVAVPHWQDVHFGDGELIFLLPPKLLTG